MKQILQCAAFSAASLFVTLGAQAQITDPSPYCVASFDEVEFYVPRYITEVKLGTLTNTTGETHFNAPHYVYYNNLTAPDLQKGQTYTLTVGNDGSAAIHFMSAYIDFNGNNQFDLPQEMVLGQNIHAGTVTNPSVATFTVPMDAVNGVTRMRVMIYADDNYTWIDNNSNYLACTAYNGGTIDWGETEDYNVNITGGSSMGISTSDVDPEFRLAPNPANGFIAISNAMKGNSIEILSVDGRRLMLVEDVQADKIDVSNLPVGSVIVRILTNDKVITQTLVIQ